MASARDAVPPEAGDYILRDTKTPGLGLRVYSSGEKTWVFQKKLAGTPIRIALGPFPTLPLESKLDPASGETYKGARQLAEEAAAMVRQGLHPRLEKKKRLQQTQKEIEIHALTMGKAWDIYVAYKDSLVGKDRPTDRTFEDWHRAVLKLRVGTLWHKPVVDLTGHDILQEFTRLVNSSTSSRATNGGLTQAACLMRYVRSAYRYSIRSNKLRCDDAFIEFNALSSGWQKQQPRNRRIGETEGSLARWWDAVENLRARPGKDSNTIADWLQLTVFFGTRRTELLSLKWSDVDLKNRIIYIPETSTKGRRGHLIPMTQYVTEILQRRYDENQARDYNKKDGTHVGPSTWVFPSSRKRRSTGEMSYLREPKNAISKVVADSGVPFSAHDLRRTFATILDENGASSIAIDRALNHAPSSTAAKHYVNNPRIMNLRKLFQTLEDAILIEAGVKKAPAETFQVSREDYELLMKLKAEKQKDDE